MSGDTVLPRIIVPDTQGLHRRISSIVDLLSFINDTAIQPARLLTEDELIPENDEDESLLSSLGTKNIHHETTVTVSI